MRSEIRRLSRAVLCAAVALFLALAVAPYASAFPEDTPRFGSAGSVSDAQGRLVKLGYLKAGGYADGRIDDRTADALRDFQRDHRLQESGALDTDTVAMLVSHPGTIGSSRSGSAPAAAMRPSGGRTGQSSGSSREMPATGGRVPLVAGIGGLLAALGFALWRGFRA